MTRFLDDLRSAPEKLADRSQRLRSRARQAMRDWQIGGTERLFDFHADTLENVEKLLDDAPELPVVSKVADAAGRLVHRRLEGINSAPLPDYDDLNVRQVNQHLSELPTVDLLRIRRYEQGHKGRKTVLAGVQREIDRRARTQAA